MNNLNPYRPVCANSHIDIFDDVTKWISVNERLPKEDGEYLVSRHYTLSDNYCVEILKYVKDLSEIDDNFRDKKGIGGWIDWNHNYGYYDVSNVVAWIPLPKPYKEIEVKNDKC